MNTTQPLTSLIKHTRQVQYLYLILIAWTIIGFLFRWDNNMQVGCTIQSDNILGQDNIFFSATSIILLTLGVSFQRNNERIWFLFLELLYWLLKLFYWKGGYGVGIGGIPIFTVVFFDMIALFLRIMLLNATLEFKFANNYILIPLFIFFYVKLYFFQ
ncbi:hypothetical protein [Lacibacter sp. H407]|uniref:hypothetical protein n=1 Tax=Lacibacter sp. H407 TaxID=3133423 RepID=UPI0030BD9BA2